MANITIAGRCYIVTSKYSLADLEMVKKHRPKALKLFDEEAREEIFAVDVGRDDISKYGVSFSGVSNDEEKLATATLMIPQEVEAEEVREYVAGTVGGAITNLNCIEDRLQPVLDEIRSENQKVLDSITVIV